MRSCVCSDSLRLLHFPLSADHVLSYHPVLPPAHQLHLPRCGGQVPCALQLVRTVASLPSTTHSKVMSPTTRISETTEPYIQESSVENGSLNDIEYYDVTIGEALSSPLFTQEREYDASRRRSYHSQDKVCRPASRRPSVMIERRDPL